MQPALHPGERVLVATWLVPRLGDIVVLRDPERTRRYTAKRVVAALGREAFEVRGDNANVSRDSRHFGSVPRALVVGRVVFRYGRRL